MRQGESQGESQGIAIDFNGGRPLFEALRSRAMEEMFVSWRKLRSARALFEEQRTSLDEEKARQISARMVTEGRDIKARMFAHLMSVNDPPYVWSPDELAERIAEATEHPFLDDSKRHDFLVASIGGDMNGECEHPIGERRSAEPSWPSQTRTIMTFTAANDQLVSLTAAYPRSDVMGELDPARRHPIFTCQTAMFSNRQARAVAEEVARFVAAMWRVLDGSCLVDRCAAMPADDRSASLALVASLEHDLDALAQCTRLWLTTDARGDGVTRRLRNALCLMQEVHHSRHAANRLALAWAAIEALVGREGDGERWSESVASRLAALLEPDANRRGDSHRAFLRLNGKRNHVIHGSTVEPSEEIAKVLSALCGVAIRAVMQCTIARERDGQRRDERMFFEQLDQCAKTGCAMEDVDGRVARHIPYHLVDGVERR
jgi:hypothetical protein